MNKKFIGFTVFALFGLNAIILSTYFIGRYFIGRVVFGLEIYYHFLDPFFIIFTFICSLYMYKYWLKEIKKENDDSWKWLMGMDENE